MLHTIKGVSYHVDNKLSKHWDKHNLKHLKKINNDRVYIVDGRERSGKSWWAIQQAGYLDPEMFETPEKMASRICFTPEDFFKAVRNVKNGVIVFDEAFRGFSSRAALSKTNKKLIQALMEMGQNNNIVFIILPSFFLLDIYPAMLRSDVLFNIYINNKNKKRVWRGFNRADKNTIYQIGVKKGWKYVINTRFKGRFYGKFPGGEEYQKAYDEKKLKALREMDEEVSRVETEGKFQKQRNLILKHLYEEHYKSFPSLSEWLKTGGVDISATQLATLTRKMREKEGNGSQTTPKE